MRLRGEDHGGFAGTALRWLTTLHHLRLSKVQGDGFDERMEGVVMGRLKIAPPAAAPPQNVAAKLTITAFTDGQPMNIRATCDPLNGLLLLAAAVAQAVKAIQQQQLPGQAQADPVDKPRQFLGPRSE